jgi:hypothetical protein
MFNSLEKSFLLLVYAKVMACASPPTRPCYVPHCHHVGDPRVLEFLDITATIDASFPTGCSDSGSTSLSSEIFQRRSFTSRTCSDDSMSQSS